MRIATYLLIIALVFGLALPISSTADSKSRNIEKASQRSAKAAQVFSEIMDTPDKGIPQYIIDRAECIAVFPSVLKIGFIFGGRGGTGLLSVRDPQTHQWQPPIFLRMGGGSFGAQIGGQSIDVILVGMSRRSAELFTRDRFELGGELSATAGPVGRNAAASTDLPTFRSEILSYSRSRGLFAGVMIKGAVICLRQGKSRCFPASL
jgi:SH3 domain-containing YSC84-like protein 1